MKSAITGGADESRSVDEGTPRPGAACEPVSVPVLGSATSDPAYAAKILALSNAYRVQRGLPPLTTSPVLVAAAAEYARFFVATQFWVSGPGRATIPLIHYDADCRTHSDRAVALGYPDTLIGENVIYADVGVSPRDLWAKLLSGAYEDPARRDPRDQSRLAFDETGVACFTRRTPEPPQLTCVQVFGQAKTAASPTATNTPTATATPIPAAPNTPLPIATNTPPPADTPSPSATNTTTNTPTATRTRTPTPTSTPTPTPTPTETPTPPVIF